MIQNTNNVLNKARKDKKDEFYTQYRNIEEELSAYLDLNPSLFRDKTVFCPCDNPEWSNFTKYFLINFKKLGLKKLISVGYATECLNIGFDFSKGDVSLDKNSFRGKLLIATESNINTIDVENPQWGYLEGNGDFRNEESRALRDEADFIITNPPFSLFREFIKWVFEANKKFLLIGNLNASATKDIFNFIKENKMWFGKGFKGMEDNIKAGIIKGYCFYDNLDALEVSSIKAIPSDYEGAMGVPITFLDKYCPDQFDIIDLRHDLKCRGKSIYARIIIKLKP